MRACVRGWSGGWESEWVRGGGVNRRRGTRGPSPFREWETRAAPVPVPLAAPRTCPPARARAQRRVRLRRVAQACGAYLAGRDSGPGQWAGTVVYLVTWTDDGGRAADATRGAARQPAHRHAPWAPLALRTRARLRCGRAAWPAWRPADCDDSDDDCDDSDGDDWETDDLEACVGSVRQMSAGVGLLAGCDGGGAQGKEDRRDKLRRGGGDMTLTRDAVARRDRHGGFQVRAHRVNAGRRYGARPRDMHAETLIG